MKTHHVVPMKDLRAFHDASVTLGEGEAKLSNQLLGLVRRAAQGDASSIPETKRAAKSVLAMLGDLKGTFQAKTPKAAKASPEADVEYRRYRNLLTQAGKAEGRMLVKGWAKALAEATTYNGWVGNGQPSGKQTSKPKGPSGAAVVTFTAAVGVKGRETVGQGVPEDVRAAIAALDLALSEAVTLKLITGAMHRGVYNAAVLAANKAHPAPVDETAKAPKRVRKAA